MTENEHLYCQICGEELEGQLVWCAKCKTPHHGDCWEFYGGCSTYGCGGNRALNSPPETSSNESLIIIDSDDDEGANPEVKEALVYIRDNPPEAPRRHLIFLTDLLATFFKPAYYFWPTIFGIGKSTQKRTIFNDIFGDEITDLISSILKAPFYFFVTVMFFLSFSERAGHVVACYLIFGPLLYSFFTLEDLDERQQIRRAPSLPALPTGEKKKHKNRKRKKRRMKKRRKR